MIRSFLFVPGDSARKLEKSLGSEADALIVDLEDSVAQASKAAAREITRGFLDRDRGGKPVYVRVNAFDTGMLLDDLREIMPGRPDGIMLPKSAGGPDITALGHVLDGFEAALGLPQGGTLILPVATETPQAVLNLASYAGCGTRLWGLMWGAEDLAGALGASGNKAGGAYRSPFRLARDQCLLAAIAAGVVAVDTVFTDVADHEGLAREASEARLDGFGAKAAIHPAQCGPINRAFTPDAEEIAHAHAILAALASAGGGVATLHGRMVDKPHEVQARRILDLAGRAVS